MARDQQPIGASGLLGEDGDHLGGGQALLGELSEQPVLAERELVGQLLDDVRHGVGLDEPHDVTMETEDTVHLGKVPVGQPLDERERCDLGVQ